MLAANQSGRTFCPSEVVRVLAGKGGLPDDWRNYMEEVRRQLHRLQQEGKVVVSQRGEEVFFPYKGAIRWRGPS